MLEDVIDKTKGGLEQGFKEVTEHNPIIDALLELLENIVKYEKLQVEDDENLKKFVEVRQQDIEAEIESIKKELEELSDSEETKSFKKQRLEMLEIQHKKLLLL